MSASQSKLAGQTMTDLINYLSRPSGQAQDFTDKMRVLTIMALCFDSQQQEALNTAIDVVKKSA